jgi:hypothetical protein
MLLGGFGVTKAATMMIRLRVIPALLIINTVFASRGLSWGRAVSVSSGPDGTAQITLGGGRILTIPKERGQVGISDAQIASDGAVGWLADYSVDGVSYPIAGTLVVWRAGKPIRRFRTDQTFYSWAFYAQGKQVAYHTGPLHGEQKSHCELRDVASGRKINVWAGDLDSGTSRPIWTEGLNH